MHDARTLAYVVLGSAADALDTGASLERIQDHFVTRTASLLADAETNAVLAATGDASALAAIERNVAELAGVQAQLAAEFGDA